MRGKRDFIAVGIFFCVCCAGATAQVIDLPLNYEHYSDRGEKEQFRPHGYARLDLQYSAPKGEWKLPPLVSARPVFAWVRIGEEQKLLVVDKSGRKSKFFDRAYFDANGNGDLTDDPVLRGEEIVADERDFFQYFSVRFFGLDTTVVIDGVSLPYSFTVSIGYYSNESVSWWTWFKGFFSTTRRWEKYRLDGALNPFCMYRADLDIDDTRYHIYLSDANVNGHFNDLRELDSRYLGRNIRLWAKGDGFYLIPAAEELTHEDRNYLERYLHVADTLYMVEVFTAEQRLVLTPVEEPVARIELPVAPNRIVLAGEDVGVMSCFPGTTLLAPPGTYRLLEYVLFREEPSGARWRLYAAGMWDGPEILATSDEATVLMFGEPYRASIQVTERSREEFASGQDFVELRLSIFGSGSEVVAGLECVDARETSSIPMADGGLPRKATYRIVKPDGEVAAQGSFEYG